jgi:hypothetical protein
MSADTDKGHRSVKPEPPTISSLSRSSSDCKESRRQGNRLANLVFQFGLVEQMSAWGPAGALSSIHTALAAPSSRPPSSGSTTSGHPRLPAHGKGPATSECEWRTPPDIRSPLRLPPPNRQRWPHQGCSIGRAHSRFCQVSFHRNLAPIRSYVPRSCSRQVNCWLSGQPAYGSGRAKLRDLFCG